MQGLFGSSATLYGRLGGEYEVGPTEKSLHFVRVCERAGGTREINCGYLVEFAGYMISSFSSSSRRPPPFAFTRSNMQKAIGKHNMCWSCL